VIRRGFEANLEHQAVRGNLVGDSVGLRGRNGLCSDRIFCDRRPDEVPHGDLVIRERTARTGIDRLEYDLAGLPRARGSRWKGATGIARAPNHDEEESRQEKSTN
jgi:hypothetical protein